MVNLADFQSNSETGLTVTVRELTAMVKSLKAEDLSAADRTALCSLLDDLEGYVRTANSPYQTTTDPG